MLVVFGLIIITTTLTAQGKNHHNQPTTTTTRQPITAAGPPINLQVTIGTDDTTSWSGSILASTLTGGAALPIGNLDISGSGTKSYVFPCQPMMEGGMKEGAYVATVHIDASANNPPLLKLSVLMNGQVLNSTSVNADAVDVNVSGLCTGSK